MVIKFIICDLGGVYFTDGTTISLKRIKSLLRNEGNVVDELFRESPRKEGFLLRMGKLKSEEFWKIVSEKLNANQSQISEIKEIWHSSYKPNEGMRELLQKLRKVYKIVVFSGNVEERINYLEKKYDFLKDFDHFVFSFKYGMSKHDSQFFLKLLEVIDAKPEECLFIDDKNEFLEIGRSLGMKTVLFKDTKTLERELQSYDVSL